MSSVPSQNKLTIKIDQQFPTPCSTEMRYAFEREKAQLKREGVQDIEQIFKPIQNALNILYESELSVYQQEYAIRLELYYLKMKEIQDTNRKNTDIIEEIEKKIKKFENDTIDFFKNKDSVYALKQHLIDDLAKRGVNVKLIFN